MGAWSPSLPLSRENKVGQRLMKNSSVVPLDISLQHIGTKGVRRRSSPPVSGDIDRVSPVPVFSLNYGAVLVIAPYFFA